MVDTKKKKKPVGRAAYSFEEFGRLANKDRSWVYRQVKKGRVKAITGFGAAMIPASEVERIFGSTILETPTEEGGEA